MDFTVADVLAWARTKPADERYNYVSNEGCAIAQFLKETGRAAKPHVNPVEWRDGEGDPHAYDRAIADAANEGEDTFGNFAANLATVSA